jgi:hypothetical protein
MRAARLVDGGGTVVSMAKKHPDPKPAPTKAKRAAEAEVRPVHRSRDFSQRAYDIVREVTDRHADDTPER